MSTPKPDPVLRLPCIEGTTVWAILDEGKTEWLISAKRGMYLSQTVLPVSAEPYEQALTWEALFATLDDYALLDIALQAAGKSHVVN